MRIEKVDAASGPDAARALYDIYRAGAPVDDPGAPAMSFRVFGVRMRCGWCGEPRESWLARDDAGDGAGGEAGDGAAAGDGSRAGDGAPGGGVVGGYTLELPERENRDRAALAVLVAPAHRRAGTGTALLRHAADRARTLGRVTLTAEVMAGTPGDGFAQASGAAVQLTEARRTLDVSAIPPGYLAELRASVKAAAAGYEVLDWSGDAPGGYLDGMAELNQMMGDAPHGAGEEVLSWDAARVREVEKLHATMGLRHYSVAARAEATGELAGLTELSVDPADPEWGHQEMTVVSRAHRGRRLGLLLKVAMLELLADREPQIRSVLTYNAESNQHMIAVNEALGHRVSGRLRSLTLAADAVP